MVAACQLCSLLLTEILIVVVLILVREGRPYVFTDLLRRESLDQIIAFIEKHGGFIAEAAE